MRCFGGFGGKHNRLIDGFFSLWMTAWLKSWIVAFPTILVVAPLTRRLVGKLVRNTPS